MTLRIDGSYSLKDKRRVLRSLLDRARRDYHVAAAEVADQDLWNCSVVGVACVTNDVAHADSILEQVVRLADSDPEIAVESCDKRLERRS